MQTHFTADTHFNHANIIRYCRRPFGSVREMNEALVSNWNRVVAEDDVVYHLGDFGFGGRRGLLPILDRCMQMHGAGGLSRDYFLAEAFNYARWCRQADGPDQVHQMALGKQIIERYGE